MNANWLPYRGRHPRVAGDAWIAPGAWLIGDVIVGASSSVWFGAVLRGDINRVEIGARSNVQDGSVLHVTHELACIVGDEVTIGHNATVHGCIVEDGCLIGMGAVVLSGARVGAGSLVAAGAVVGEGKTIPPRTLVAGVPARVVRTLDEDAGRAYAKGYVEEAAEYQRTSGYNR